MTMLMRKLIVLVMLMVFSINTFAVAVSDNDGSAFITKAEFDSLKNSFQSQIDSYNSGIDSKIDNAIASYLSGITITTKTNLSLDSKCLYDFPIIMDSKNWWNDVDVKDYYSVSCPDVQAKTYSYLSNYSKSSGKEKTVFASATDCKMYTMAANTSQNYAFISALKVFTIETSPHSAFLNIVGNLDSTTRKIGTTAYKTRERSNAGKGYDVARYWKKNYSGDTGGGLSFTTSTDRGTYHYHGLWGFNDIVTDKTTTSARFGAIDNSKRVKWTNNYWASSMLGKYEINYPIQPITPTPGFTITDFQNYKLSHGGVGWGANSDTINDTPKSNIFNWEDSGKVSRVYAGLTDSTSLCYVPAEKSGRWSLWPQDGITINSEIDYIKNIDNSTPFLGAGYLGDAAPSTYAGPFYAFNYGCFPKLEASDNASYMPGDADADPQFSKLPACLVYYLDSSGNRHYLDEGMFLQKFIKSGKLTLELKFGAKGTEKPNIKIMLSRKPFDRDFNIATDIAKMTVGTTVYSTGYTLNTKTSGFKVKMIVDDIKKEDELYLYWEPTTSTQYCDLQEIVVFELEAID